MDKYDEYDSKGYEGIGPMGKSPDPFNTQWTHDDPARTSDREDCPASERQIGGQHYAGMAIQPSEFIVANDLGWYEGNAVKYICRHSLKGGATDIEKAIHYLELLLESKYGE